MSEHLEPEDLKPILERIMNKAENPQISTPLLEKYAHVFLIASEAINNRPPEFVKSPITGQPLTQQEITDDLIVKFFMIGYFMREEELIKTNN